MFLLRLTSVFRAGLQMHKHLPHSMLASITMEENGPLLCQLHFPALSVIQVFRSHYSTYPRIISHLGRPVSLNYLS